MGRLKGKGNFMIRILIVAFSFGLLSAPYANSEQKDAFGEAIEAWLRDDDAGSLPTLADLAKEGHSEARLLLARIETEDRGHSRFRSQLTAEQSRQLFRAPPVQGRAHRPWLAVEADRGNRLAALLLAARQPEPRLEVIEQLFATGEREATDHPTRIAALYDSPSNKQRLRESSALQFDLIPYLEYLSGPPEPRGDGLAALRHMVPEKADQVNAANGETLGMAGILALGLGYGDTSWQNRWRKDVEGWILGSQSTRPIADLCRHRCPGETAQCSFALFALTGGYFEAIRLDTPLESTIPQAVFLQSPRARNMTLRRAAWARTETNLDWLSEAEDVERISMCAAEMIHSERAALNYDPTSED